MISCGFIVPHPPLIVPEVGKGQESGIQTTIDSFYAVARRIAELQPQTIVGVSPHSVMYSDYIHISPGKRASGSLSGFGARTVYKAEYDEQLVGELCGLCRESGFPAGTLGEKDASLDHGTLIPLHFINQYYSDYKLVRCSISGLSHAQHYRFGMLLSKAIENAGRSAVIVASGDMSHKLTADGPYGFAPEGPELDRRMVEVMKSGDFGGFFEIDDTLSEKGAQCGLDSFIVMAGAFDRRMVTPRFYSYEGPFGVGYGVSSFEDAGVDETRAFLDREEKANRERIAAIRSSEDIRVRLARNTLESFVTENKLPPVPDNLPEDLKNERAGVFVSIKMHGRLRGCIGTTAPTAGSIAEEIRQNAVSSGTRDPRFDPVTQDELGELVYNVDVLSPAEPCEKADLDVKRYGVIVANGRKRGLLLPDLDGVDTVDDQIRIACQKAGIGRNEGYILERFEVTRYR